MARTLRTRTMPSPFTAACSAICEWLNFGHLLLSGWVDPADLAQDSHDICMSSCINTYWLRSCTAFSGRFLSINSGLQTGTLPRQTAWLRAVPATWRGHTGSSGRPNLVLPRRFIDAESPGQRDGAYFLGSHNRGQRQFGRRHDIQRDRGASPGGRSSRHRQTVLDVATERSHQAVSDCRFEILARIHLGQSPRQVGKATTWESPSRSVWQGYRNFMDKKYRTHMSECQEVESGSKWPRPAFRL